MTGEDVDGAAQAAVTAAEVVHRRWLLSKRPEDGRPLFVREDRIAARTAFGGRSRRGATGQSTEAAPAAPR